MSYIQIFLRSDIISVLSQDQLFLDIVCGIRRDYESMKERSYQEINAFIRKKYSWVFLIMCLKHGVGLWELYLEIEKRVIGKKP